MDRHSTNKLIVPDECGHMDSVILDVVGRDYSLLIPWTFILNSHVIAESGYDIVSGAFYNDEFEPLLLKKWDLVNHIDKKFLWRDIANNCVEILHIPHRAHVCAHVLLSDVLEKKNDIVERIRTVGLWEP